MRGPVVAREHLRTGSAVSLFLALFFIPSNAEEPASHSLVGINASEVKWLRSQLWDMKELWLNNKQTKSSL